MAWQPPTWAVLDNGAQFTPDGQSIIFHSYRDQAGEIWIMNTDGNKPQKITQGSHHNRWPLVSSDGKKIAFVSRRMGNWDVFTINVDGSELRQVTDTSANELGASFSPDGKQLVYAQANQSTPPGVDLILSQADGSKPQLLVKGGVWPVWSAVNKQIIYGKPGNNPGGIYIFDPIKKTERQLVGPEQQPTSPTWSHDGKRVYFVQNSGTEKHVFSINIDGSKLTDLGLQAQADSRPTDSPDGDLLVWGHDRHGNTDLFIYDLIQQQQSNLTPNSFFERWPDINHQTGALLISSRRDGNGEIYLQNKHGHSLNLSNKTSNELGARWAPDGKYMAYSSDATGVFNVYEMDVHQNKTTQLTHFKENTFVSSWHPDSNRIMVTTGPWQQQVIKIINTTRSHDSKSSNESIKGSDGSFSPDGQSIVLVRQQGNQSALIIKQLITGKEHELTATDSQNAAPAFSPDGQQIAFASNRDGDMEIYVVDSDGGNLRQITNNQADDNYPRWSHSGQQIYFDSNLHKNQESFVVNADGTGLKRVSLRH